MTDPGIQFEEMRDGKRRWFEPRFTLGNLASLLGTALVGAALYYSIIGNLNSQASEIEELKVTVSQVPALAQHVAIIDNTISINKAARDKAMDDMSARLDKLTDVVGLMSQNVAALTATIKAQELRQ